MQIWKNAFWPDVKTIPGRKAAINAGAFAAGWIAGSYVLSVGLLYFTGKALFYQPADQIEWISQMTVDAILAAILTFLCWRIWKCEGHISAIITLCWTILEIVAKFFAAPGKGIVVGITLSLFAINGVRGTFAYRKWLRERETDLQQRGELS